MRMFHLPVTLGRYLIAWCLERTREASRTKTCAAERGRRKTAAAACTWLSIDWWQQICSNCACRHSNIMVRFTNEFAIFYVNCQYYHTTHASNIPSNVYLSLVVNEMEMELYKGRILQLGNGVGNRPFYLTLITIKRLMNVSSFETCSFCLSYLHWLQLFVFPSVHNHITKDNKKDPSEQPWPKL